MGISRHNSEFFPPRNIAHSSGIRVRLGARPPHPRLLSLVVHIKLNGFANAAFRFAPLVPSDPSTPAVYTPAIHFAFRPKLIGLRIGRLELFILCPAINQFLRRPNRGRKDRTATRATKRRTTSGYSPRTKRALAKIERTRKANNEGRVSDAVRRSVNFAGKIIGRATATPFNFIIRSNDAEDAPEKENKRLRAALQLYRRAKAREKANHRHIFLTLLTFSMLLLTRVLHTHTLSFSLSIKRNILQHSDTVF